MTSSRHPARRAATALAAFLLLGAASAASAHLQPPPPGPVGECYLECQDMRRDCFRACNAALADCMRGTRVEMRACRGECLSQFGEDTPELEACVQDCREEIVVPARQECAPLRKECGGACSPGACLPLCAGDGLDEVDACRAECAVALHECAREGRGQLKECLAPCREMVDAAEREACAIACTDEARAAAVACHESMQSCSSGCEAAATTTTTLPVE